MHIEIRTREHTHIGTYTHTHSIHTPVKAHMHIIRYNSYLLTARFTIARDGVLDMQSKGCVAQLV